MRRLGAAFVATCVILGCNCSVEAQEAQKDQPPAALGEMTLHIIPQSHIDLAWRWRYDPETLHVVVRHTLETAYENMEKFPDYTFTHLQVPAIEPMETLYPELFWKFRYYVNHARAIDKRIPNPGPNVGQGRLAIGSAAWCEFEGCLPCGESLVRHFLYGKRYFRHEFGLDVKTCWVQDAWTHPWTLPQILKKCGVDSYMFTRPRDRGELMFWWESPDGSRVFAYKPLAMSDRLPPQAIVDRQLLGISQRYAVKDGMIMIGVGNHGGGAIREDVERMRTLMAKRTENDAGNPAPPKMIFSTPSRFVERVLSSPNRFPVIKSELEPSIRGSYTNVDEIKQGNRRSECLLMTLEKFASIAYRLGESPYPQASLFDSWKKVMLNQFHDSISGRDIPPAIDDEILRYRQVAQTGEAELHARLKAISSRINTEGRGTPVVVFNPLTWERTDAVELNLECDTSPASVELTDKDGDQIATQIVRDRINHGKHIVTVAFVADRVPSLGYKVFWLAPSDHPHEYSTALQSGTNALENAYLRVQIDSANGCLRSVYDKEQQREVLAETGKGNLVQILEERGRTELTGPCWNVEANPEIALLERGPVRTVLEIKRKHGLARFTQHILLYDALRRIDFDLAVDWSRADWGTEPKLVKVGFPLAVSSPDATYEIPYGVISRPSRAVEENAQNWADISAGDYGVSLLNDSRYGYDATPNVLRLSVRRTPQEFNSSTEEGTRQVKYWLYPHRGGWQDAHVVLRGHELNNPLLAVLDARHPGDLPSEYSFVKVEPENVVMTVLKKGEDSDHLIMRLYETDGKPGKASVTLAVPLLVDAVHAANMLEASAVEISAQPNGFATETPAWSIETYKLLNDPR